MATTGDQSSAKTAEGANKTVLQKLKTSAWIAGSAVGGLVVVSMIAKKWVSKKKKVGYEEGYEEEQYQPPRRTWKQKVAGQPVPLPTGRKYKVSYKIKNTLKKYFMDFLLSSILPAEVAPQMMAWVDQRRHRKAWEFESGYKPRLLTFKETIGVGAILFPIIIEFIRTLMTTKGEPAETEQEEEQPYSAEEEPQQPQRIPRVSLGSRFRRHA